MMSATVSRQMEWSGRSLRKQLRGRCRACLSLVMSGIDIKSMLELRIMSLKALASINPIGFEPPITVRRLLN